MRMLLGWDCTENDYRSEGRESVGMQGHYEGLLVGSYWQVGQVEREQW